jgi:hypothetical protein
MFMKYLSVASLIIRWAAAFAILVLLLGRGSPKRGLRRLLRLPALVLLWMFRRLFLIPAREGTWLCWVWLALPVLVFFLVGSETAADIAASYWGTTIGFLALAWMLTWWIFMGNRKKHDDRPSTWRRR